MTSGQIPPFQFGEDITKALAASEKRVSGTVSAAHQYHFHMETQSTVASMMEGGEVKAIVSSQSPDWTQRVIEQITKLPMRKIKIENRRMGGAFGGKITQSNWTGWC